MCSRIAAVRLFEALPRVRTRAFGLRQFAGSPIPTGIPADPSIHAVDNLDDDDDHEIVPQKSTTTGLNNSNDLHVVVRPLSSPKLESSTPVSQSVNPRIHQKRSNSTVPLEQVSCVGIDGYPAQDTEKGRQTDRKEQELDDKEYFKHHKASPLSEIQIADTRKPLTRATDSKYDSGGGGIITWLPEQLVSADETLRRASEIFKQNAMRGDPDSPHGRRLRELRGEWW